MAGLDSILAQITQTQSKAYDGVGEAVGSGYIAGKQLGLESRKLQLEAAKHQADLEKIQQQYLQQAGTMVQNMAKPEVDTSVIKTGLPILSATFQKAGLPPLSEDFMKTYGGSQQLREDFGNAYNMWAQASLTGDQEKMQEAGDLLKAASTQPGYDGLAARAKLPELIRAGIAASGQRNQGKGDKVASNTLQDQLKGLQSTADDILKQSRDPSNPLELSPEVVKGLITVINIDSTKPQIDPKDFALAKEKLADATLEASKQRGKSAVESRLTEQDNKFNSVLSQVDAPGLASKVQALSQQNQKAKTLEEKRAVMTQVQRLRATSDTIKAGRADENTEATYIKDLQNDTAKIAQARGDFKRNMDRIEAAMRSNRADDLEAILPLFSKLNGDVGNIGYAEAERNRVTDRLTVLSNEFGSYLGMAKTGKASPQSLQILRERVGALRSSLDLESKGLLRNKWDEIRSGSEGGNRFFQKLAGPGGAGRRTIVNMTIGQGITPDKELWSLFTPADKARFAKSKGVPATKIPEWISNLDKTLGGQ